VTVPDPDPEVGLGAYTKLWPTAVHVHSFGADTDTWKLPFPAATFDAVESIRVMNHHGVALDLLPGEFAVEYRSCPLLKSHVALGTVFRCRPSTREEVEQRMNAFSEKRWSSQPAAPSAGCMFKNPAEYPAGRLIDELGLKGTRMGGAMVSLEHGNFIVNDREATAHDVLELIAVLKARVKSERGIELHTEVEIIGED